MNVFLKFGKISLLFLTGLPLAASQQYLIRFENTDAHSLSRFLSNNGGQLSEVSREGKLYKWVSAQSIDLSWDANIRYVQPNYSVSLLPNPSLVEQREKLLKIIEENPNGLEDILRPPPKDNPEIETSGTQPGGGDPMVEGCWGIISSGAQKAWKTMKQGEGVVIAVTDTGVDYNHEDLRANMWRNAKETPDGKDNDGNGYVDDIVGWDFASNDNKPFDLTVSLMEILLKGGNPGHGTHVAGVAASVLENKLGSAGVAPKARIMALRFISESGKGSTESAVKAIDYAVNNGAQIINASWGGEAGEEDDTALREAIKRAESKGVIFVAAAGNGRLDPGSMSAKGFDNDGDKKPIIPASLPYKNIVAVSALDSKDQLASFSNWGSKSVRLGAPGVKIYSTIPGNRYQDTVIDFGELKVTWDGTSMAAPFVAGALAVVWSQHKNLDSQGVIDLLLSKVHLLDGLKEKVSAKGRLDLGGF